MVIIKLTLLNILNHNNNLIIIHLLFEYLNFNLIILFKNHILYKIQNNMVLSLIENNKLKFIQKIISLIQKII